MSAEKNTRKISSSLKVGILTLVSIAILIVTVLWIKGRTLSAGERIDVIFHDINGIRAGSAVQMMGLRIGQIEEIIPVINGKDSHVKVRFVVTEDNVTIPSASVISVQQSGLIGEQFLEVTPPKAKTLYTETSRTTTAISDNTDIYMDLSDSSHRIGKILSADAIPTSSLPIDQRMKIKTRYTLKLDYVIELPGLILDPSNIDMKMADGEVKFYTKNGESLGLPDQKLKYTVVEPMRISDFLELQYQSAKSLADMNEKVSEILSDDFIYDIQTAVQNMNQLTKKASTTIDKAEILIDSSTGELTSVLKQSDLLVKKLVVLSDNLNDIVGDKELKQNITNTTKSVGELSTNLNKIVADPKTKEMVSNLNEVSKNLNDISIYVNEFTKDEKLKQDLKGTISGMNKAVENINTTLANVNSPNMSDSEKLTVTTAINDAIVTSRNLKTFSEKLNKRFLLFRLMF